MKKYLMYHGKWQLGFFVVTPVLYICLDVLHMPYWLAVITFQFLGALIFFPIDNWIFKQGNQKS